MELLGYQESGDQESLPVREHGLKFVKFVEISGLKMSLLVRERGGSRITGTISSRPIRRPSVFQDLTLEVTDLALESQIPVQGGDLQAIILEM